MRHTDVRLYLGPADHAELDALRVNRNTPCKLAWQAGIFLATTDGAGTVEIMGQSGMSKPTVWRCKSGISINACQGGSATRRGPPRVPPLSREIRLELIAKTVQGDTA
jgi:hypothetical protein